MSVPFDGVAIRYDEAFTHTQAGQMQRHIVWRYFDSILPALHGREVLELNCGTGEDALYLASKGCKVLATDASSQMLYVARNKIHSSAFAHRIVTRQLDLNHPLSLKGASKYDLVMSNFGGINCIDPLSLNLLLETVASVLNPGGRFIMVVMPKFHLAESLYFLGTLQWRKVFRRLRKRPTATLNGKSFPVWYYSPRQISKLADKHFDTVHYQPVGICLAPNSTMKNKYIRKITNFLESRLGRFSQLSVMSDHFLIDLTKR